MHAPRQKRRLRGGSGLWTLAPLGGAGTLWRISLPPSRACDVLGASCLEGSDFLLDWAGGLIWVTTEAASEEIRGAAAAAGGHAMMVRADERMRSEISAFHPQAAGVAALEARVRRAFDPAGLFETGRF